MPSILYDIELWREYANEMHALRQMATDPRIRQHALAAAAGFDRIAALAERLQMEAERRRRRGWAA